MALKIFLGQEKTFLTITVLLAYLSWQVMCETGDCRQQEFRDRSGNCVLCKQCGPGMEMSKECGFGYGEDAQCVTCRPHRFKEDWGFQKCKPCLDCALVNRFQKANCSATGDAVCGECLPGFYRKTKLVGFQDMECVPCGDPPPPYEPHCTTKVNLVKIPSAASSPRDTALAAVICSALATVLLALLILCVIYCKRQFMEKKPSWPVHLVPSLCRDEARGMERALGCAVHSKAPLHDRTAGSVGEMMPTFLGSLSRSIGGEFSDAWPLMRSSVGGDNISFCESYPDLTGEDIKALHAENDKSTSVDSNSSQDLAGGAVAIHTDSENVTEMSDLSRRNTTPTEPTLVHSTLPTRCQQEQESGCVVNLATPTSLQEA